jgi:hypothetical protein
MRLYAYALEALCAPAERHKSDVTVQSDVIARKLPNAILL